MTNQVITYQDDAGRTIDICVDCKREFQADDVWPHNRNGQQFASVSRGQHTASCDTHSTDQRAAANIW
jgi:hypothetical protein